MPRWQDQFINLIHNRDCPPLVRLVTIVAYYEACECLISNTYSRSHGILVAFDTKAHPKSPALHDIELSQDIFDDAKECLRAILAAHKHRDGPRVVALLRPLTKHQVLRERILTQDVLETLVKLLDVIVEQPGSNFGQAMDGLNCLLRCGALVMIMNLATNSRPARGHPYNYHREARGRFTDSQRIQTFSDTGGQW